MLNDSLILRPSAFVCRTAAIAALACASTLGFAQQSVSDVDTTKAATAPVVLPAVHPMDFSGLDGVSYSSSTEPVGGVDVAETATLDIKGLDALQPPPRRRYGNRRYNDSSHNPDGSNKYAFIAGVGVTIPAGNLHKYDTESWGFQVGGGRNFNKHFSVLAQFDYDHFGLQGTTLTNQNTLYGTAGDGLDGNSHIWSFTVNPTYNIAVRETLGAYVVGGVGFYHKVTNFTLPETGEYFDPYYGPVEYTANEVIDHYTSNAPGFNGGFGLTYKPSRFAGERFYAEARYVYMINSQKQGITVANANSAFGAAYTGSNFYPANSNRTSYIPIKVGVRF
ncbi:outer membrane beta-barrel protein [Granulicella tundricola]|uniref:Outer membrane protein beta-barrel domain-containing protein n=1 Tax=Granulicella tundricola (strain ATCC BAA-1859 / DSM 23138 / MP5ACTX9) TaxID=1198114 RepID=E8X1P8_GRATM|nr:outer membrane beta-barrel protein [Granulicella tundricola]ADW67967.1 hypothetical protein AciX9_0899 [Granulicella tundricola MP5ACTX9]